MARGDIVLSRREHRDLVRRFQEIKDHHSHRMVDGVLVKSTFAHDPELHEDEGHDDPEMKYCPQCNVITHCTQAIQMLQEKAK